MNLPNLKEARIRSGKKSTVYRNDYEIPQSIKDYGIGKKYYMLTYGCQMNVHDSENIKAILEDLKYTETTEMEALKISPFLTLSFRSSAVRTF